MRKFLIIDSASFIHKYIIEEVKKMWQSQFLGILKPNQKTIETILTESPDLIFISLDNLPFDTFKYIERIRLISITPITYITLSSDKKKAFDSYKHNIFDILLYSSTPEDVIITLKKIQKELHQGLTSICIKSYKDYQYLEINSILFLKADNNTTDFFLKNGDRITAYKTLKHFEKTLPSKFLRIHKSYIVNSSYVCRIHFGKKYCKLNNCKVYIPFTKTYQKNTSSLLNLLNRKCF